MKIELTLADIGSRSSEIFYSLRWGVAGVCCPECGSVHIYNPECGRLHICADCGSRFSDTSGTIFHSTKLGLDKWLYGIYLFLTSTRGISSYSLGRLIGVSQTTAWSMLMRLRSCLGRDLRFDVNDRVAIDEVYLGSNWSYKPMFKKYAMAGTPPPLCGKALKLWYRQRFYELAGQDKMPVLGMVSLDSPRIALVDITSEDRSAFIRGQIRHRFESVLKPMFPKSRCVVVTDQSQYYKFLDRECLDHNNVSYFDHHICHHDQGKYSSEGGVSSNKLEGAFSHIKRAWKGVYQFWSKKYNQLYLNEYCFRYNNPLSSKTVITDRLQEFFRGCDPRALVHFV